MKNIRRKIIFVDDTKFTLNAIKERLGAKYEVFTAQSIGALFEILENILPDVILLDIHMPEADGFKGITRLKSDARYAGIPVIFVSSKDDRQSIVRGMGLGAIDFLMKPVSTQMLIDSIENQFDPDKRNANKPVVLAVDDNPSILQAVYHALRDQYRVHMLHEPQAIEGVLKSITPDLFLLDCQMPEIHGFDLVPIIRSFPMYEKTPIVFLTSDATVDNLTVALYIGACDFIVKPVDGTILREKMAKHLADYIMRRNDRARIFGEYV